MTRDRSKLPSFIAGGPPELVDKKTKDRRKSVWQSEQARRTAPQRFTIMAQVSNTFIYAMLKKNFPRLDFDESNNQLFLSTVSYRVTGTKDELKKFLISDFMKMKLETAIGTYPELK
jgi:hypothetical protein